MQDKVPLPPHPWRLPMDEQGAWGDKEREVLLKYGAACAAAAEAKALERAAQVCESKCLGHGKAWESAALNCAAAIRALAKQEQP